MVGDPCVRSFPTASAGMHAEPRRAGCDLMRHVDTANQRDLAGALADTVLPDQDGNDVRLGDLWQTKPVALVWLRHYG